MRIACVAISDELLQEDTPAGAYLIMLSAASGDLISQSVHIPVPGFHRGEAHASMLFVEGGDRLLVSYGIKVRQNAPLISLHSLPDGNLIKLNELTGYEDFLISEESQSMASKPNLDNSE